MKKFVIVLYVKLLNYILYFCFINYKFLNRIFFKIKILYYINIINWKLINNIFYFYYINGDWGLGIGDWGLGIGDWAQSPIPNPHLI